MNRTVIIVKDKSVYRTIRLHWEDGQKVMDWLNKDYGTIEKALELVWRGHRSTIAESYAELGHQFTSTEPHLETFKTLRDAKAWCEYKTLAYHNGKRWRFEHKPQGV
jgi:hypothetical protein